MSSCCASLRRPRHPNRSTRNGLDAQSREGSVSRRTRVRARVKERGVAVACDGLERRRRRALRRQASSSRVLTQRGGTRVSTDVQPAERGGGAADALKPVAAARREPQPQQRGEERGAAGEWFPPEDGGAADDAPGAPAQTPSSGSGLDAVRGVRAHPHRHRVAVGGGRGAVEDAGGAPTPQSAFRLGELAEWRGTKRELLDASRRRRDNAAARRRPSSGGGLRAQAARAAVSTRPQPAAPPRARHTDEARRSRDRRAHALARGPNRLSRCARRAPRRG